MQLVLATIAVVIVAAAGAEVVVEDSTACLDPEVALRVGELLVGHAGLVSIVVLPHASGRSLTLRWVSDAGDIELERRFEIDVDECGDASRLVDVVLREHLAQLALDVRAEVHAMPPEPPPPPAPPPQVVGDTPLDVPEERPWFELGLRGALGVGVWPVDGEASFGVFAAGGYDHAVLVTAQVRASVPKALDRGTLWQGTLLLGAGWRYRSDIWEIGIELRTGAMAVVGSGFAESFTHWIFALEGAVRTQWRIGPLWLGPEISATPLVRSASVVGGSRRQLPLVQVALVAGGLLWPAGENE